jgi:hypothetical protein
VRVTSRGDAWREWRLATIAACCGAQGGMVVARSVRNWLWSSNFLRAGGDEEEDEEEKEAVVDVT